MLLPVFVKVVIIVTQYLQPNGDISSQIANSHTLFNSINALIFLPLTKYFVMFLNKVIKPKDEGDKERVLLDNLLLDTPVAALEASRSEIIRGTEILRTMTKDVMAMIYSGDIKKMATISDNEAITNEMQKELTRYIVKLSKNELTESQSIMVPVMITSVNNLERAGDRVIELASLFQKKIDGGYSYTEDAIKELEELESTIVQLFDNTITTLSKRDSDVSERIADHTYKIAMLSKDELFGEKRKR